MSTLGVLQAIRQAGKAKNNSEQDQAQLSFIRFIWQEKRHRRFVRFMIVGTIIQFVIFKLLYPFADFFSDSYSYIYAASANLDVSIWPIGYSKFLRWFHFITYSDTALITFQYFFLELSCLYFFFSILYFYRPVKANQIILFIFLFFNPLFIYISNYVNSDPLFIALSVLWFTELLWILKRPNLNHILIQGLLIFLCFTVRNNAYIYPFVTIVAFALSRLRLLIKVSGALLGLLFIIPFIINTRNAAYKMTGTKQFSLFTGWQLANNALYIYEFADTTQVIPESYKEVDKLSRQFYSHVNEDFHNNYLPDNPGNFFIQYPLSPLKEYFRRHYKVTDYRSNIIAWSRASAVFAEYGSYIIKKNPAAYFHEFIVPNINNYLLPHLEKLEKYNLGVKKVDLVAKNWFHYKTLDVTSISSKVQGKILYLFPLLFIIINSHLLISTLIFWLREKYKSLIPEYNQSLLLAASLLSLNFAFCIFSTIIVLRYQVFPMIICLTYVLLLTEWLDKTKAINSKHVITNIDKSKLLFKSIPATDVASMESDKK